MKHLLCLVLLFCAGSLSAAPKAQKATLYSTTASERMVKSEIVLSPSGNAPALVVFTDSLEQQMTGFGGTFNELGWDALQSLTDHDRDAVMAALFSPQGLNLVMGRTPIGANDFSMGYYSYNDVKEDYTMRNFCIDRDRYTLIPYIQSALKYRPDLIMWASPWTPPLWMKVNEHYSEKAGGINKTRVGYNELDPKHNMTGHVSKYGHPTGFKMMDGYLEAYAIYFSKYVQEYAKCGINIQKVAPQNEVCWTPCWTSCTWRPEDLYVFVHHYLGPQFEKDSLQTEIWYSTINYPFPEYLRTILECNEAHKYVKGIGVQWTGLQALPTIHSEYPDYDYMMTENMCGDHENDWTSLEQTWQAIVHCLSNGVTSYNYFNMVLNETGKSWWDWPQNSMVIVDRATHTYSFTDEYWLFRHLSPFVQPGAVRLKVSDGSNTLAFRTPEGKIIVVIYNPADATTKISLNVEGKALDLNLKAKSINTLLL